MTSLTQLITADELLAMSNSEVGRCELIGGEIIEMPPPGTQHGRLQAKLARRIGNFVEEHDLGDVLTESGYIVARDPDTVRAPDVAYIRKDRLPSEPQTGYFDGAPDLAAEVLSPNDVVSEVLAKIDQWLDAGAISVWLVDPTNRQVQIYHRSGQITRFRNDEELRDEDVLPGFMLKLSDLFA